MAETKIQDVLKFDVGEVAALILERLAQLKVLDVRQTELNREVQLLRQTLVVSGENPFPENTEDNYAPTEADESSRGGTVAQRAERAIRGARSGAMSSAEIFMEIQASPFPLTGKNPMATLITAMSRSKRIDRVPDQPSQWTLVGEALNGPELAESFQPEPSARQQVAGRLAKLMAAKNAQAHRPE